MVKPLPATDHRALRHYLEPDDYGLSATGQPFTPLGVIDSRTWRNLVGLSDSVAIETSDEFAPELERVDRIGWSWLDVHDALPENSPAREQTLSALETFQASAYNALNGWYRIAGICLRCGLEDMLLGLYFQGLPNERETFDSITEGTIGSPRIATILRALTARGAPHDLVDATKYLYHEVLSVHVHLRSDGRIWESNGPVYVPTAFRAWLDEYETTYLLVSELIDSVVAGTGARAISNKFSRANFRFVSL